MQTHAVLLVCRALLTDLSSHPPLLRFQMTCNHHLSANHPEFGQPLAHALRSPQMPLHSTDTPDLVTVVWNPAWGWPTLRDRAQQLQAVGNSATLTGSFASERSTMAQPFLVYSSSWPWGSSTGQSSRRHVPSVSKLMPPAYLMLQIAASHSEYLHAIITQCIFSALAFRRVW